MRVHLIGVCGTGMGALGALLREAGHDVSGSDTSFDPPIGPFLDQAGIQCFRGYAPEHLGAGLDLVVVGNVIRRSNVEAMEAERLGLRRASMSGALRELFLLHRKPLVVSGTHGKTTTSSMAAWILQGAGLEPGWFIGGLPKNLPGGSGLGRRSLTAPWGPFVVEGDEYDAVYWQKEPKFFDYVGVGPDDVAIVTSVELDHVDIYPDVATYEEQFVSFVRRVPAGGLVVCDAHDARAVAIVSREATARTVFYGLEGDAAGEVTPTWLGAPGQFEGAQSVEVFVAGTLAGRFLLRVPGLHNVRNAVGALAACVEGFGVPFGAGWRALGSFEGVARRQDLLGVPGGVRVYDDFAHHPTAVRETLRALRAKHAEGALWAIFEPRSATACRKTHQDDYTRAFDAADRVLFAPLGRSDIAATERLDLGALAKALGAKAEALTSVEGLCERVVGGVSAGDTVVLLSNGALGGLAGKLMAALQGQRLTHQDALLILH